MGKRAHDDRGARARPHRRAPAAAAGEGRAVAHRARGPAHRARDRRRRPRQLAVRARGGRVRAAAADGGTRIACRARHRQRRRARRHDHLSRRPQGDGDDRDRARARAATARARRRAGGALCRCRGRSAARRRGPHRGARGAAGAAVAISGRRGRYRGGPEGALRRQGACRWRALRFRRPRHLCGRECAARLACRGSWRRAATRRVRPGRPRTRAGGAAGERDAAGHGTIRAIDAARATGRRASAFRHAGVVRAAALGRCRRRARRRPAHAAGWPRDGRAARAGVPHRRQARPARPLGGAVRRNARGQHHGRCAGPGCGRHRHAPDGQRDVPRRDPGRGRPSARAERRPHRSRRQSRAARQFAACVGGQRNGHAAPRRGPGHHHQSQGAGPARVGPAERRDQSVPHARSLHGASVRGGQPAHRQRRGPRGPHARRRDEQDRRVRERHARFPQRDARPRLPAQGAQGHLHRLRRLFRSRALAGAVRVAAGGGGRRRLGEAHREHRRGGGDGRDLRGGAGAAVVGRWQGAGAVPGGARRWPERIGRHGAGPGKRRARRSRGAARG